MARVQVVIPDEDRDRFVAQARREGLTLSAWLRAAAGERLAARRSDEPFETAEDLAAFFRECDAIDGPEREPDWEEQRKLLRESQLSGITNT